MFGLNMLTQLVSFIKSTMSTFAEGFAQGRNADTAPPSEVTTDTPSQPTEFSPMDPARISWTANVDAALEADGYLPGSTTIMKPVSASDLSACETFVSPACGVEAVTPFVTAFQIAESSVAEIIESIDVASTTFPEFAGLPPIPTDPSAFSDEDIENYQPEYIPPTTRAHEQYIKDMQAATDPNPSWAANLWFQAAAEDMEMKARWHSDRGMEYAQAAGIYQEATESIYARLRGSEAHNERLTTQNSWLFANEHQVCFNNPITLYHHTPINTSSHHLWITVFTRSVFAIVVGIAVLYALFYVLAVFNVIVKRGRSAFEQLKEDVTKFVGILHSLAAQYQEAQAAAIAAGPPAAQQVASPTSKAAVEVFATQQQGVVLPTSEAVGPSAEQRQRTSLPPTEAAAAVPGKRQQAPRPSKSVAIVKPPKSSFEKTVSQTLKAPILKAKTQQAPSTVNKVVPPVDSSSMSTPSQEVTVGADVVVAAPIPEEKLEEKTAGAEPMIGKLYSTSLQLIMKVKRAAMAATHRRKTREKSALRKYAKKMFVAIAPRRRQSHGSTGTPSNKSAIPTSGYSSSTGIASPPQTSFSHPTSAPMPHLLGPYNGMPVHPVGVDASHTPPPVPAAGMDWSDQTLHATEAERIAADSLTSPYAVQQLTEAMAMLRVDGLINQPLATSPLQDSARHAVHQQLHVAIGLPLIGLEPVEAMDTQVEETVEMMDTQVEETVEMMETQVEETRMPMDLQVEETVVAMDLQVEEPVPVQQDTRPVTVQISAEEEAMDLEGASTNMNIMAAAAERGQQDTARVLQEASPARTSAVISGPSVSSSLPQAIANSGAPQPQVRPAPRPLPATSASISRPFISNGSPQRVLVPASPRPQAVPQQRTPSVGPSGMKIRPSVRPVLSSAVASGAIVRPPISNGAPQPVIVPARPRPRWDPSKPPSASSAAQSVKQHPPAARPAPVAVKKPTRVNGAPVLAAAPAQSRPNKVPQPTTQTVLVPRFNRERLLPGFTEEEEGMNEAGPAMPMSSMAEQAAEAQRRAKQDLEEAARAVAAPAPRATAVQPPSSMPAPLEHVPALAPPIVTASSATPAPEFDWNNIDPLLRPDYMNQPLAPPPPARPNYTLPSEQRSPVIDPALNMPEPAPWTAPQPMIETPVATPPTVGPAAQRITARPMLGNRGQEVSNINAWSTRLAEDQAHAAQALRDAAAQRDEDRRREVMEMLAAERDAEGETPAPVASTSTASQTIQTVVGNRKVSVRPSFKPSMPASTAPQPEAPQPVTEQDVAQESGGDNSDDDERKSLLD
ncbi:hypothetical protein NCC49_001231 [Naganishia albida]|nr:hypothetical protein NCC49_001231 [Naganishia albida]